MAQDDVHVLVLLAQDEEVVATAATQLGLRVVTVSDPTVAAAIVDTPADIPRGTPTALVVDDQTLLDPLAVAAEHELACVVPALDEPELAVAVLRRLLAPSPVEPVAAEVADEDSLARIISSQRSALVAASGRKLQRLAALVEELGAPALPPPGRV